MRDQQCLCITQLHNYIYSAIQYNIHFNTSIPFYRLIFNNKLDSPKHFVTKYNVLET